MDVIIILLLILFSVKRVMSCSGITGNTTQIDGTNFQVLCNTTFGSEQVLSLLYTVGIDDCLSACVNLDGSVECVGIQYSSGTMAPDGPEGSLCYLQWAMNGSGSQSNSWDSARVQPGVIPNVRPKTLR
jgi:hypothetical protein